MLSTSNTSPLLHHTNEFSVPRAIRSASTPSGSFATVDHVRATSLDTDLVPASASAQHSLHTSRSTSQLLPRSSILINARKRPYSGVIYADPATAAGVAFAAAPVVTHIPAVPSRKEREKEKERLREREKEKERERERARSKDEEKIWGIPKKALLLGLGDLNFNAQMAMMAGWGHGSGGASILPSTAIPTNDRKRLRSAEVPRSSTSSRRSARDSDSDDDAPKSSSARASRRSSDGAQDKATTQADGHAGSSPIEERMDPEELAALNAIINTRRSMAAAQALVSGSISITPRPLRPSTSFGNSTQDLARPPLDDRRFASQDSVPSVSSVGQSSVSAGSSALPTSTSEKATQLASLHAATSSTSTTSTVDAAESKSPRIRFAPLPTPTAALPTMQSLNGSALVEDSEESDISDSDYDSDDDAKSMKGKWYLMGMPSAYFKPEYYTKKSSKRRSAKSIGSADGDDRSEDGHSLRRKSTGSLSDGTSADATRRPASDHDEEERGRASSSSSKVKRKSSQTRRRSRSRTGAISSGDEDERARRKELIRLARPGGTGMVTLPDGTKIRARRVNDLPAQDEPEFIEWGFAGLAREASRRSLGGSGPPSLATTPNGSDYKGIAAYMEANENEEDDDSGMAWVRRRRREREAKARMEREQAEKLAAQAPAQADEAARDSTPALVASTDTTAQDPTDSTAAVNGAAATAPSTSVTALDDASVAVPSDATVQAPSTVPAVLDEPMPLSLEVAEQPPLVSAIVNAPPTAENDKRQSLLTSIDTARPVSGLFAGNDAFVASPAAEEPSAGGLEASMLSEHSNGDSAMSGSQVLGRANRAVASESGAPSEGATRQNTGLGLTASKAEEIRRRHEDEVAALGAEVLAQTRRNNQRRQASSTSRATASSQLGGDESAAEQHQSSPSKSSNRVGQGAVASPPVVSGSAAPAKATSREGASEKKSISRAVGSIMRKATTDSEKTIRYAGPTMLKHEVIFPQDTEAVERKHLNDELPVAAAGPNQKHTMNASLARIDSPESTLSRKSSAVSGYAASAASKSASSLHNASSSHAASSPLSQKRISLDPSVSTPAPSPWLPRRPDARGVAVVPLPQLGVRPERPREGRVWQSDDSDASDADKDELAEREGGKGEDEEEEEGSDLDAEELLEEERKTAMQKKRATTRAAGQEVVHARLGKKASARALSDLTASYDDMALVSTSPTSSSMRRKSGRPTRRSSMDPRMASNASRSPAAPRKAPPKLVRSRRSVQSIKSAEDEEDDMDERDLWPAVSATSKSGTPRPRHMLVNLPGGPGIWDSKTGGGRNAVAAINSVAAARAKAIKKRARDRRGSLELPPDWDDEMMDYGWPRSLKGSLY
ncbi:hypothetical protein PHSY_001459 [Pseudozyma hubeiensis SY62]|uniref:Uncharacterized protein n=1 Tax=Pseudozyma hubeiensis (strain SY62) TaxID=1305764 RepID=R9NYW1_PSEHS|nr:hypothetical protein PHSY_001459 [Pseudozyma hubeiensis SY62]GAC93891.1 hypothetical protein PHSY_001459 [Pseudozyma hubeiensis SY62]